MPRVESEPSVTAPSWAIKIMQRVPLASGAPPVEVLYHRIVTAQEYMDRVATFGVPPGSGGALVAASLPGRIAYVYGCLAPGKLHPLRVFDVWLRPLWKKGWAWTPWFSITPRDAPPPSPPPCRARHGDEV